MKKSAFKLGIHILGAIILLSFALLLKGHIIRYLPFAVSLSPNLQDSEHVATAFDKASKNFALTLYRNAVVHNIEKHLSEAVTLVSTNSNYASFFPASFLSGGYFLSDAVEKNMRYIIIPESLALEWFLSCDVIGQTVYFDEAEYTICGVYKSASDFLSLLSSRSTPVIYTSCFPDDFDTLNESVRLYLGGELSSSQEQLIEDASIILGYPFYGEANDFRQIHQLLLAFFRLSFISICVFPLFLTFRKSWQHLANSYINASSVHQSIKHMVSGSFMLILGLLAFYKILNSITIPAVYLPTDNIFAFSHYSELIISFYQNFISQSALDISVYIVAFFLPLLVVSLLLFALECIKIEIDLYRIYKEHMMNAL